MENPAGYLWAVGRNHALRQRRRRTLQLPEVPVHAMPWVEPDLPVALGRLSDRERAAVVLVHGVGWSYAEVADLFGIGKSTVQKHVDRGMGKLRRRLGVTTDAD